MSLPRYQVHRTANTAPPDWQHAACLANFTFPWEHTPPPRTEFRALWDDQSLHFCFDCDDEDIVLGSGKTALDRVLVSDRVEIFLAPDLQLSPYYCLEMSPNGDLLDYRATHYRQFERGWTCPGLTLSASICGKTYRVEGHLQLATLRELDVLKPAAREFFAGVFRGEFSHEADGSARPGWMTWIDPKTERPDFHVPTAFGVFELLD